jgi:hypothetical protein
MPAIPTIQEAEEGGWQSKISLDKSTRPYLKTQKKQRTVEVWLKW